MLTSSNDALKRLAAHEALQFLKPGMVLGVGTGSTVNHFIALIHAHQIAIDAAVSSSNASSELLRSLGIRVIDPNTVEHLPLYVDGADEVDPRCRLIKGGGGALTREKILADLAERFVCIVDEAKCVPVLGGFPLPIEVLALARAQVTRKLEALGAKV
ncbi:MAG: ribose-5-phosphate isomerase RpiA, partial [Betaproteobacteria bacterium]|nr:ribose-5-phosphate isomerase RpiA [Betaproteobacteria bacterium]